MNDCINKEKISEVKPIPEKNLPRPIKDEKILELPSSERLPALLQGTGIKVTVVKK